MLRRDFLKIVGGSTAAFMLPDLLAKDAAVTGASQDTDQLMSPVNWFFSGEKRYGLNIKYFPTPDCLK